MSWEHREYGEHDEHHTGNNSPTHSLIFISPTLAPLPKVASFPASLSCLHSSLDAPGLFFLFSNWDDTWVTIPPWLRTRTTSSRTVVSVDPSSAPLNGGGGDSEIMVRSWTPSSLNPISNWFSPWATKVKWTPFIPLQFEHPIVPARGLRIWGSGQLPSFSHHRLLHLLWPFSF